MLDEKQIIEDLKKISSGIDQACQQLFDGSKYRSAYILGVTQNTLKSYIVNLPKEKEVE